MSACKLCGLRTSFIIGGHCAECSGLIASARALTECRKQRQLQLGEEAPKRYSRYVHTFSNGTKVLVCTPHSCTFLEQDGITKVVVPRCGATLRANPVHVGASIRNRVNVEFMPTAEGIEEVKKIRAEVGPDVLIVGSLISSMAYDEVVFLVPAPGFDGAPPNEKAMSCEIFARPNK